MRLYCKYCKKTIKRDGRRKEVKASMSKRGYESYCVKTGRTVYMALLPSPKRRINKKTKIIYLYEKEIRK